VGDRVERARLKAERLGAKSIATEFNRLYYETRVWRTTTWLGIPIQKAPTDLWAYQEIIHQVRPSVIVETGTLHGGSAHYLAGICQLAGRGRIVSVDIAAVAQPPHPLVTYVDGSSTAPDVVEQVRRHVEGEDAVLVILDSDHSKSHVLDELRIYGDLVTPGSYLIVEDTNLNGNPVSVAHGPGPAEALDEFLASDSRFRVDDRPERLLLTFNPRGYLLRQ
jgi:cephalosporin hydroxylase